MPVCETIRHIDSQCHDYHTEYAGIKQRYGYTDNPTQLSRRVVEESQTQLLVHLQVKKSLRHPLHFFPFDDEAAVIVLAVQPELRKVEFVERFRPRDCRRDWRHERRDRPSGGLLRGTRIWASRDDARCYFTQSDKIRRRSRTSLRRDPQVARLVLRHAIVPRKLIRSLESAGPPELYTGHPVRPGLVFGCVLIIFLPKF